MIKYSAEIWLIIGWYLPTSVTQLLLVAKTSKPGFGQHLCTYQK